MKKGFSGLILLTVWFCFSCNDSDNTDTSDSDYPVIPAPVSLSFQVINQFPHDTTAFTEGFSFHEGNLYESTGAPEPPAVTSGTWIASVDLQSGKYDKKINLGKTYFGEGITFLNGKLYQLTYRSNIGFVYDAKTFKKIRDFRYQGEGWGLTTDGKSLIMSTGSSNLYYINPDSLTFTRMLAVQNNNGFASNLNELEYIGGYIYANEWLTSNILKIDPATGYVVGKLDLGKQVAEVKAKHRGSEEMNGIAHDTTTGKTFITGKKWPVIYEIRW